MSRGSARDHLSEIEGSAASDAPEHPLSVGPLSSGRRAAEGARRNRSRDSGAPRDRRPVPKEIKLKAIPAHLQLTDPINQYGRWYFNLKGYLLTLDPKFKTLLETEDEHNDLYHYQWALARLITALVVDSDATYVDEDRWPRVGHGGSVRLIF